MKKNIRALISTLLVMSFYLFMIPADVSAQWVHSSSGYSYRDDGTGEKLTGWQSIGGEVYYFNDKGIALTGWQKIDGSKYYFSASQKGRMMTGKARINGKVYDFGEDGILKGSAAAKKSASSRKIAKTKKKKIKDATELLNSLKYGMSLSSVLKQLDGYDYDTVEYKEHTHVLLMDDMGLHILFIDEVNGYFMRQLMIYCPDELDAMLLTSEVMKEMTKPGKGYSAYCEFNDGDGQGLNSTDRVIYIMTGQRDGNYYMLFAEADKNLAGIKTRSDIIGLGEAIYSDTFRDS